jgi:flagellar biosynthesis/type III secretory pathway chaperone
MKNALDRLVVLLKNETELYRSLLEDVGLEKKAILKSDIDRLTRICKRKENTMLKIQILEEQRLASIKILADNTDYSPEELTLRKLIGIVPDDYALQLQTILNTWKDLIGQIRGINQHNRGLLMHSVDLVRGSLALLNNLINATPVYQRSGTLFNQQRTGTLFSGEF